MARTVTVPAWYAAAAVPDCRISCQRLDAVLTMSTDAAEITSTRYVPETRHPWSGSSAETATFGDFLDALAARRGGFALTTSRDSTGRVHVRAEPDAASIGVTSDAANAFDDLVSHVTGEVITNAADIDTRDQSAETELDTRLIPGIPTYIQYPYLGALLAGLLGWPTARGWWLKLRARLSGNSASGPTGIGRVGSEAAFALIFLPIVGGPAFAVQVVHQSVEAIRAPFRWMRRRFLTSKV